MVHGSLLAGPGGPRTPVFLLRNAFHEGALKPEISDLQRQVQKNCDISDARHAGVYSLCGLLLRMRDLYKWEHRMVPGRSPNRPIFWGGWKTGSNTGRKS